MKLTAFMTAYKFKKTDEDKDAMVREHVKHEYMPIEKKVAAAQRILDSSYRKKVKDPDGTEREVLFIDSVGEYMLTCITMIDLYTDIERSKGDGKVLEEFNTMNAAGIIDRVIAAMDQRELKEFNMILKMTRDDLMANEYENHAFVREQVERFGTLIGTAFAPVLAQLDTDKIEEIIDKFK